MEKPADTKYPVIDIIKNRWSPRAFGNQEITPEQIKTILEAASWAPSGSNVQPWRYIFALKQNKESFAKILSTLVPANAVWAKNAAALILSYAKVTYDTNGKENQWALHDTGLANENLLLQATSLNIYCHPMAGFDQSISRETFHLSNDFKPVCVIALGFPGDPASLEEPYKSRELAPRTRMQLSDFSKEA